MQRFSRLPVVVAASAVVMTACGGVAAPAAVVSGHRISVETLRGEVETAMALSDQSESSELTRSILTFLIQSQIAVDYAGARGISVTPAEVDQELASSIEGLGGQDAFDDFLRRRGLTVGTVRRVIERSLLRSKVQQDVLAGGAGPIPAGADQEEAFRLWLLDEIGQADVQVNPRFGHLDPSSGSVVAITSTADLE